MTPLLRSRRLRWAVPAIVAAGVAAAAITSSTSAGASSPNLAPRTAAQLLAAVEQAKPGPFSGTVVETANLGLPDLPSGDAAGAGGVGLQTLLTGSHTVRVWYGGQGKERLAIMAPMAERDVIRNGRSLWTYTSTTNEVTHATLPAATHESQSHAPDMTPQQAAEQALRAIDPSTQVVVDRTASVAGRSAYQLDLLPRDSRSLIGSVRIAIDAATSMPLQVQVFARGASSPALQIGFTDLSMSAPSASVFDFVKPAGATVVPFSSVLGMSDQQSSPDSSTYGTPTTLGSGWTAVVKLTSQGTGSSNADASSLGLLQQISTRVPGGQLVTTPLVSILIARDGTIYAGPVGPAALQQVAATGHGL